MENNNEFIDNFIEAIKIKMNDKDPDPKALEVIKSVCEYGKNAMGGQSVINYFFADHGWMHSVRLSRYALFMIKHLKKEKVEQFKDEIWYNMLVLLWTAIALHDIGMNDISENEEELTEIIVEQVGRIDHVVKSGEWISRIIDHMEENSKMDDVDEFVKDWEDYWDGEQKVEAITALRMVKDIVLMHGENENWLVQGKIGALDRNVFEDIDESKNYKEVLSFDEAILCLADLLDICPERMNIFSNKGLNKYFEKLDEEKKYKTFEHWASHNLTSVDCTSYDKDGYIKLIMFKYAMDEKVYLNNLLYNIYPDLGAVEACLKWGNDERLKKILGEDFGFKGIKLGLRAQKPKTWKNISKKAAEYNLFDDMGIININNELGGISNIFVNAMMSDWIERKWEVDKRMNDYHKFRSVFHMIQKGASLYLLYDKVPQEISRESIGYFIELMDENQMQHDINDTLLAAINVFYEKTRERKGIKEVKIIEKGGEVFSSLYNGTNRDKDTAYIIFVRSSYEDDLNKIIQTVQRKGDSSFVIFGGMENRTDYNTNIECQYIKFKMNSNKFNNIKNLLNEYAIKKWASEKAANEKETKKVEELLKNNQVGIGSFVKELKIIYNGIQHINEQIVADLAQDKYSSLFILDLFEMMSDNGQRKREVKIEDLELFYNEFCEQNKSRVYNMDNFGIAINTLLRLCENCNGNIVLLDKYSDSFDNLIRSSIKEMKNDIKKNLFQMMIFFWLYNYRKVNFKSVCYREYLTYLSPDQLCNYIYNTNIRLTERINISFETSEIIVDELRQNFNIEGLKLFVNGYIHQLLNGKNDLIENEDFISFQSIYRIFRGILAPDREKCIEFIIDIVKKCKSPVGYLGFIEGVCSANISEDEDIYKMLDEQLNQMLEDIFESSEKSIKYMAYDILFNYEKNELREKYKDEKWENICAALHYKDELKKENEGDVYDDWRRMRETFMQIINETSESIWKRNEAKNEAERIK